jgi:hypothetical protein
MHDVNAEVAVRFKPRHTLQVVPVCAVSRPYKQARTRAAALFIPHGLRAVGYDGRVHAPAQAQPGCHEAVGPWLRQPCRTHHMGKQDQTRQSRTLLHQPSGADYADAKAVNFIKPVSKRC